MVFSEDSRVKISCILYLARSKKARRQCGISGGSGKTITATNPVRLSAQMLWCGVLS